MRTWLRDWSTRDDTATRLLCFPGAGSGPQMFRRWARLLPGRVGLLVAELPGHGARMAEPPETDMARLVDGPLVAEVSALLDRPLVVFGHSMGALVALELCRRLGQTTDRRPALFVAAACAEPAARHVPADSPGMSDAAIVEFLRCSGGTSADLLAHEEYRDLLVPVVRADFSLVTGRRFDRGPVLGCPVRAYVGASDPAVGPADAAGWRGQSDGDMAVVTFDGGHYFFRDSEAAVIRRLCDDIGDATGDPGTPAVA